MNSLHQDEIRELEDKDLQLQYLLGGLNTSEKTACGYNAFWNCDIRCSCNPIPNDDRLAKIKEFRNKHNISNETFMRLVLSYLKGSLVKYNGEYGELILDLDKVLRSYNFKHSTIGKVVENDLKEKELLELLVKYGQVEGSSLNNFLKRYSLTPTDFMVLAKTSINYNFKILRGFEIKDLPVDLKNVLEEFDLYQSWEYVKEYRKKIEEKLEKERLELERISKKENKPKILSLFKGFRKK